MKKILLASFIMFGILGYSQHSKKKVSKKPTKKVYSKKKSTPPKKNRPATMEEITDAIYGIPRLK